MVLPFLPAVVGLAITAALAVAAYVSGALTAVASLAAAAFGGLIVVTAGFPFLAMLVLFVVASVLATRYGFEEKRRANVHEGTVGERGVSNVLAHVIVPTALVLLAAAWPSFLGQRPLFVLYASALAFGAADTFASEFGVLAGGARSILSGRRVPPGTNGGVSGIGELFAFVGALVTAVVGLGLFALFGTPVAAPAMFLIATTSAGFIGCQADSVLGELLENRGYLTKATTNVLGMSAAVAVAALWLLGAPA